MTREGSRQRKAGILLRQFTNFNLPLDTRQSIARELLHHKKLSKVSWDALGISENILKLIEVILKDEPAPIKMSPKTKALFQALHPTSTQT
jgi:hypothetical protein